MISVFWIYINEKYYLDKYTIFNYISIIYLLVMFKLYGIKKNENKKIPLKQQQKTLPFEQPIQKTLPLKQTNQMRLEPKIQKVLPLEQHSKYILPGFNIMEDRHIIPQTIKNNSIELDKIISDKTIVHILNCENGFGDFLRGSILLALFAKKYNVQFKIDISKHPFSKYICVESKSNQIEITKIELVHYTGETSNYLLVPLLERFVSSNENVLCINTNLFYNLDLVTDDIKLYINSVLKFHPKYYEIVKNIVKFDKYNVLHIRCKDEFFDKEFDSNKLLVEIIKLQLDKNTIIISNNYCIKRKIHKLFGFFYIDNIACHTAHSSDLESTILDYIILSKSQYTHCFSFYPHGSGFSEHCSFLNNIPYTLVFLPEVNITTQEDIQLLGNHYNEMIDWPIQNKIEKKDEQLNYSDVAFITLTNSGYIDYTLNCLKSLNMIKSKINLQCYCIGKAGYNVLIKEGYGHTCYFLDDEINSNMQTFRNGNWSNITYYKFKIIYENLLKHSFVCITDGDIVYENNGFIDFLLENIADDDLLIQSEGLHYPDDLCSGFMFIKSNETTKYIFNPENVEELKNINGWDDQVYVNNIKYKLKYKKLPLSLFPTGNHYYTYSNNIINPYLIHFNWCIGHKKKEMMLKYKKWYHKLKICQHGTDGFGHQLEGMLRLISLDIHNKVDYQYLYKSSFTFEHQNFDITKLNQYLVESLNILYKQKNQNQEQNAFNQIKHREQRNFSDIFIQDPDYMKTLYLYDGVSSNITEELPPNFETKDEIQTSLSYLRNAFVKNNKFLPEPSYINDRTYKYVCCHIRMGDAIGQRILDNVKIGEVIRFFQNDNKYQVVIHSDGMIDSFTNENTILHGANTDVLQILSDFIYADILIMNYSSISIAAHLLGNDTQFVICPSVAGESFQPRILEKCVNCDDFLLNSTKYV